MQNHIEKFHGGESGGSNIEVLDETEEENPGQNDNNTNLAFVIKNTDGKYECNECLKVFKSVQRFLSHLKNHDSISSEDFKALKTCLLQEEAKTNDICEEIKNDFGSTIFRCKSCNVEFDTKKRLLLHVSIHKNVSDAKSKGDRIKQTDETQNCHLCNKSFNNNFEFKLHMQAHEENNTIDPTKVLKRVHDKTEKIQKGIHTCQYCGKEFKRPHEKVKHEVNFKIF